VIPQVIRTQRTILRPYRPSDVDDVLEYAGDARWRQYLPVPEVYTRAHAEQFIARQAEIDRDVHPIWAIEVDDHVVGGLNVHFTHEHRIGELGYALAPRLWGQGVIVEAARAVITASFVAYEHLARMRARTDARNTRSLRVMEKLGMNREALLRSDRFFRGELVDEVVCGMLRHEWRA
jgi:ribosomal-protein-alanine N-acetyltransferase